MQFRMKYLLVSFFIVFLVAPQSTSVAVPNRRPIGDVDDGRTVTYRYKARITDNAGITPFKVGELISGTFTYDLDAKQQKGDRTWSHLDSVRNDISFEIGGLPFSGNGKVMMAVCNSQHEETFNVLAPDMRLPEGWQMDHTGDSLRFGVLLQNAPPKGVITALGIPDRLVLDSFVNTHEVRLDFGNGVRFPGGQAKGRATVMANIESLIRVRR